MAVAAEMSGVLNKMHVILYRIKIKIGIKPPHHPQFETVPKLLPTQKKKREKRTKKTMAQHFRLTPRLSHSVPLCNISRPPRYRQREKITIFIINFHLY